MTQGERITALETEFRLMKEALEAQKRVTSDAHEKMNAKLDSLISLRDKGAGAFWLGTTLFGTSILGLAYTISHWFK